VAAALATLEDLAALLGREVTLEEQARATRLLDMVSAAVRSECRQTLSFLASEAVRVYPVGGEVWLPERPVTAVTSVSVPSTTSAAVGSGAALLASAYWWRPDGRLGLGPSGLANGDDGYSGRAFTTDRPVDVVYSHGFSPVPDDLAGIVCGIAARHLSNPDQVSQRSIGAFSEQYEARTVGTVLAADEKAALCRYRRTVWSPRMVAS